MCLSEYVIVLSIDAHTKEVYEDIRVRATFEKTLANVKMLREIRDKHYPDSRSEMRVSGVHVRDDQDEVGFQEFWSQYTDTVSLVKAQARWDTYANPVHPDHTDPCVFLWERMYIWWDGKTNPCDEDYKSFLSPGMATETFLKDIWHGEALTQLRKLHQTGQRCKAMPCDRCGV